MTPPDITDNAAKSLSDRELLEAIYAAIQKAERIWSALQNGNGIGAWRAARKVKPNG